MFCFYKVKVIQLFEPYKKANFFLNHKKQKAIEKYKKLSF